MTGLGMMMMMNVDADGRRAWLASAEMRRPVERKVDRGRSMMVDGRLAAGDWRRRGWKADVQAG